MTSRKRVEKDSLGEIKVPADKYWGAQTERSFENFLIGSEKMPIEVTYAFGYVKKACAIVNAKLGILPEEKRDLIIETCDEIIAGKLDDHFPLVVWQTGSGTQSNMNVNEVISNRAIEKAGGVMGSKKPIHPNDDVNMSQSSNDTFPTAINIAATLLIHKKLLPNMKVFLKGLEDKEKEFKDIIKVGRTHLMDAVPMTLGQEFSGYAAQIKNGLHSVEQALERLSEIALGGTAVGTGINSPPNFGEKVAEVLSELTGYLFISAPNKFEALSARGGMVTTSAALRTIAISLMKIANDIRWYASGPRCGIGELTLPANEPGSSIMPGKVNPTQCEALTMVAVQVMGNDVTISFAGSQGNFQLNTYKPVMIFNLLQSIHLIADGSLSFTKKCLVGIKPNREKIQENLQKNLILATILNREIGYDKASQIVKKAYKEGSTLKEAAVSLELMSSEHFDEVVDPKKMIHPE